MLSRLAYILCATVILFVSVFYLPKWKANTGTETSLGWDAATYYWYLPATFIYHDLKEQKFGDSIIAKYGFTPDFSQSFVHSSGNRVITYSAGVAVLNLPAFAVGHALAGPLGYPADGFSRPYQVAVQLWAVLFALAGLWYFRKLLLLYFSDKTVAIVLLMLVLGTNYLNYAAYDATITHSYLFTIYALLLLNVHHFYTHPQRHYAIRIGLLTGLAVLVRPSEMVALVIPVLWGVESISSSAFRKRFEFLKGNARHVAFAIIVGLAICSIQVVYWLYVTGQPFVYSYDDKTFSWLSPHTWKYLTSYSSGWLMYNPMVLLVLVGIIPFLKHGRNRIAVLAYLILNLYVVSAWDIWWYSGIGGRAMVQSYAVIFFIAAAFVEFIMQRRVLARVLTPVALLFVYINLWIFYQAHATNSLYNTVYMSGRYYWRVLGRWQVDKEVLKLQDAREIYTGRLCDSVAILKNDFSGAATGQLIVPPGNNSEIFSVGYNGEGKQWIRVAAVYGSGPEYDEWKLMRTRVHFMQGDREVAGEDWKPQRFFQAGGKVQVHYDMRIPERQFDRIELSFLNEAGSVEVLVDDLQVTSYNACR